MEVSFIIPLYNGLAHTREALRTLQATLPSRLEHEIILVDDGSTDGTRAWLGTLPPPVRTLLNPANLGFAGACNRGAAAAQGRLLFFLNNDLVFVRGWFRPMRRLAERPGIGLVGNVQRNAATRAIDHAGVYFNYKGKPEHLRSIPLLLRCWARTRVVDAVTGACCAVRADTWRQLGGFDEGFRNGGEDVDLCLRARAAGLRNVVALRSTVRHHVSASPGRKLRDEQNSRRLARRWHATLARLAARDWCRHFITLHWDLSRGFDDSLGLAAFAYWLGLLPAPPDAVLAGTLASLERELAHWDALLGPATD